MLRAKHVDGRRPAAVAAAFAVLLAALLAVGSAVGGTGAYLMDRTRAYVNTFVSGLPEVATMTVEGTKTLEGRSLVAGEFDFALFETGADFEVDEGAEPIATARNDAQGAFSFDALEYGEEGTFRYVVREVVPEEGSDARDPYVGYDETEYRIAVEVTEVDGALQVERAVEAHEPAAKGAGRGGAGTSGDGIASGDGAAGAGEGSPAGGGSDGVGPSASGDPQAAGVDSEEGEHASGDGDAECPIVFANSFDSPDATVVVNGWKSLIGRALAEGEFSFQLFEADSSYRVAEDARPVATAVNGADGGFGFGALALSEPGEFFYVICEDGSAQLGGVAYDPAVYRLHVVVTADPATGVLSAEAAMYAQDGRGEWAAVAEPPAAGGSAAGGAEGDGAAADDASAADGAPAPYAGADPSNANGAVAFVTFANSYTAKPASYGISGDVDLVDEAGNPVEFPDGAFSFIVEPQGDAPASASGTASSGEGGAFGFGDVTFDKPGVYEYVVKQVVPDEGERMEGVIYDDAVYRVIVKVADDGEGQLVVESVTVLRDGVEAADGSGVKFVNVYAAGDSPDDPDDPDDPEPGTPDAPDGPDDPAIPGGSGLNQTGDALPALLAGLALAAAAAVAVAAFALRRSRRGGSDAR